MERAIHVIPHRLNMELLTEFYSITISLKKRTAVLRLLGCWFAGIAVWCFWDKAPIGGCICALLTLWVLYIPTRLKKRARNYYKRDEDLLKTRTLYMFDDHIEVETVVGISKTDYGKLKKVLESPLGIYLYLSAIVAVCIPKTAFTPEALEFLKEKTKEKYEVYK